MVFEREDHPAEATGSACPAASLLRAQNRGWVETAPLRLEFQPHHSQGGNGVDAARQGLAGEAARRFVHLSSRGLRACAGLGLVA